MVSEAETEDNEEFNRRYMEYVTQHVTGRASVYLYGKAQMDTFRLLRNEPNTHFRTFRRAAIPDVDVPGNLLHVRTAELSSVP